MTEYVGHANSIAKYFLNAGSTVKERLRNKYSGNLDADVQLLAQLLEKCAKSYNSRLKESIREYKVPEKLEEVKDIIEARHTHDWKRGRTTYTFFECIQNQNDWYGTFGGVADFWHGLTKTGGEWDEDLGAVGISPSDFYEAQGPFSPRKKHAEEVERKLKFVVDTIQELYNRVNALMNLHL